MLLFTGQRLCFTRLPEEDYSMRAINLADNEYEFLVELLEREMPNLHDEIHHTDDHDYRQYLKERETLLNALLRKLKEGQ
jgi:hypothetical protein